MHLKTVAIALSTLPLALTSAGCGGGDGGSAPLPNAPRRISLSSAAFPPGGAIPRKFTCDGAGTPPPLAWSKVPADAQELALLVQDPDAAGGTFTHWLVYRLPPATRALSGGTPPTGAYLGRTSGGRSGYAPPCPPKGSRAHHYVFSLLALSKPVGLPPSASAADLETATAGATLAQGRLVGTYSR